MDIALPVGSAPTQLGPLSRFVPPMDEGVVRRIAERYGLSGEVLLDPFGVSPRVAIEAARAGSAIVVIANNPISRFILERTIHPFTLAELRAGLAQIAALPKDDTRMENFLLELYRSRCARCGEEVAVDFFIWDKELGGPTEKVYLCDHCAHAGEVPATEEDWDRALDYSRKGLHYAMAVEQVAPRDDPDRKQAEDALSVYPGRAIYAITTMLNKVNQLSIDSEQEAVIQALQLSAFDAGNALWGYPDGRERPRRLIASQRYREHNLWRALESAVSIWALDDPDIQAVEFEHDTPLEPGRVHIFHGSYSELVEIMGPACINRILTVPPRPNQAFWTLSALWAAWLWGKEAAAPIKVALRRRRYDWSWHASALHTVLRQITPLLKSPANSIVYLPESEPGFYGALMSSFDAAGFDLKGRALRAHEGRAISLWNLGGSERAADGGSAAAGTLTKACLEVIESRCEPASFPLLHAAGWSALAAAHQPRALWGEDARQMMQQFGDLLGDALNDGTKFHRLGRGAETETGLYWMQDADGCGLSLSDRVEHLTLDVLRSEPSINLDVLDQRICNALKGLMTPGQRLVIAVLKSYAEEDDSGVWRVRPEDRAQARERDCSEIRRSLVSLGHRLGFLIENEEEISWRADDHEQFRFRISETAVLGDLPLQQEGPLTLVLPGGRASLLAEKSRRDPHIRKWLQTGFRILKFRHVRRLVAETTLTRSNLEERLAIDPPEHQDPQLPLL